MFKKRFTETALAVAMTMSAGAAQAIVQDVAVNGGFETGDFTGWTQFPQTGTQTVVTPGNASTYAANLNVPVRSQTDPGVDNLIKNANLAAGLLTPGATVTVTWDMKGSLAGAGGVVFVELFSELSGGGTSKAEIYTGGPIFPTADWQSFVWNTTLGPDVTGGVTLQLKTACGPVEGCGVDAYFDNITITTDVSAIPVPAAVWLFGSGLVGLVGVARRKKAA
jgi:hypothetical protein